MLDGGKTMPTHMAPRPVISTIHDGLWVVFVVSGLVSGVSGLYAEMFGSCERVGCVSLSNAQRQSVRIFKVVGCPGPKAHG